MIDLRRTLMTNRRFHARSYIILINIKVEVDRDRGVMHFSQSVLCARDKVWPRALPLVSGAESERGDGKGVHLSPLRG